MRFVWFGAVLLVGILVGAVGITTSRAQQAPVARANLSVQLRGAQKALNDTVHGVLLEYDPPKQLDLLIVGSKGKGQFTCELHSTSKELLVAIQRTILESPDISVNCANGLASVRGGVIIDLDDSKGGSFVLGAQRKD